MQGRKNKDSCSLTHARQTALIVCVVRPSDAQNQRRTERAPGSLLPPPDTTRTTILDQFSIARVSGRVFKREEVGQCKCSPCITPSSPTQPFLEHQKYKGENKTRNDIKRALFAGSRAASVSTTPVRGCFGRTASGVAVVCARSARGFCC